MLWVSGVKCSSERLKLRTGRLLRASHMVRDSFRMAPIWLRDGTGWLQDYSQDRSTLGTLICFSLCTRRSPQVRPGWLQDSPKLASICANLALRWTQVSTKMAARDSGWFQDGPTWAKINHAPVNPAGSTKNETQGSFKIT